VSIGFNNATQVLTTSDGQQHFIWTEGDRVVHGLLTSPAAEVVTTVIAEGAKANLTALAAAGDTLVAGWTATTSPGEPAVLVAVSPDGGATWSAPETLEEGGTGLSLASDGSSVVAAWQVGDEDTAEIHFSRVDAATGEWSLPVRVDASSAAPLWPSVAVEGDDVWVTWRDNRDGRYRIYLRRSEDGGESWLVEQEIVAAVSGDPSICAAPSGVVWLAYHGGGSVAVLRSADGGATFGEPVIVGSGWFARVSCAPDGSMIVGWEQSFGPDPKSGGTKSAAFVTADASGNLSDPTVIGANAGTTASVSARGDGLADVVWIDRTASPANGSPTAGQLYYAAVAM
jgi:hypothetical protein